MGCRNLKISLARENPRIDKREDNEHAVYYNNRMPFANSLPVKAPSSLLGPGTLKHGVKEVERARDMCAHA